MEYLLPVYNALINVLLVLALQLTVLLVKGKYY
jgi:hypothetical protein